MSALCVHTQTHAKKNWKKGLKRSVSYFFKTHVGCLSYRYKDYVCKPVHCSAYIRMYIFTYFINKFLSYLVSYCIKYIFYGFCTVRRYSCIIRFGSVPRYWICQNQFGITEVILFLNSYFHLHRLFICVRNIYIYIHKWFYL